MAKCFVIHICFTIPQVLHNPREHNVRRELFSKTSENILDQIVNNTDCTWNTEQFNIGKDLEDNNSCHNQDNRGLEVQCGITGEQ